MALPERKTGDVINPEDENFITSYFQVTLGIENFARLKEPGMAINSRTFDGDPKYGDKWKVQFRNFREDAAEVALQLVKTDSKEINVTFRICLLARSQIVSLRIPVNATMLPGQQVKNGPNQEWGISTLSNPAHGFLIGNKIFFNVQISTRRLKSESKDIVFVSEQFKSILINKDFTDVVLKSGNSEFPASKIILAGHSPVFFAMFKSKLMESELNAVVKIEDFSDETIKGFLEFLYTGHFESLEENVGELLKISDKYQVLSLKGKCEQILLQNLNTENTVDILVLAHLHNSDYLKLNILPFFDKHFNELKNTESYRRMKKEYPQLGFYLYEAMHENKGQEDWQQEWVKSLALLHGPSQSI